MSQRAAVGRRRAVGEGSIYFDASKDRWVGSLVTPNGRRKVTARTKTQARQRFDQLRGEVEAGAAPGDGNATIGDVLKTWQTRALAARDLAPATRDTYDWAIQRLTAQIGSRRVRSLTVDELEAVYDRMSAHLGRSSLIKLRGTLSQALDYAIRRGIATRNVARVADLAPTAKRPERRRALTPPEPQLC